jgi:predicted amino acid racemase
MLQVFYIDVAKVERNVRKLDQNVAHVAMAIYICFKCMFQMFHLY